MINLILQGKKYSLPETTSDLSFETGIEILEYLILEQNRDLVKELSIISSIPVEDLKQVDETQLILLHSQILFLNGVWLTLPDNEINLTIKGKKYYIRDLKDLTVKEYGEITTYWDYGETPLENMAEIISILYTGKDDLAEDIRKECSFIFIHTIMTKISSFFKWINSYYFQMDEELEKEEDEEEPKNGKSEWGLYEVLFNITDGDIQKMDYWLTKNILEFLKFCRFRIYNNRKLKHG